MGGRSHVGVWRSQHTGVQLFASAQSIKTTWGPRKQALSGQNGFLLSCSVKLPSTWDSTWSALRDTQERNKNLISFSSITWTNHCCKMLSLFRLDGPHRWEVCLKNLMKCISRIQRHLLTCMYESTLPEEVGSLSWLFLWSHVQR